MPIAFTPSRDAAPRYAVFGKLPQRADFVRIDTGHLPVREFDDLLASSLVRAVHQPEWNESACLNLGACDFQFTSSDGRECFIGVLHPSRDEAGRFFPLVAGIVLPAQAVVPSSPELAIANELFFSGLREQLASAVGHADDLIDCCHFLNTWAASNPNARDDIELAGQILARHMNSAIALDWHIALVDAGHGGLDDILLSLAFHEFAPSGGFSPVSLPLSGANGEDTLDEAAWLALGRTALGGARSPDFLAFTRRGRRRLILVPGRIDRKLLESLWLAGASEPKASGDTRWRHSAHAAVVFELARQLQDPALTLASLEAALERIIRNLADTRPRSRTFPFHLPN
jgi:type VI secretion system protein ImpM